MSGPRTVTPRGTSSRSTTWTVVALFALAAAVFVLSLVLGSGGEFEGSDGQAEDAIGEHHPDYEPWFQPLFEPSSGEIESGLFALQAGVGGLVVGYGLGVLRTRHRQRTEPDRVAGPTAG